MLKKGDIILITAVIFVVIFGFVGTVLYKSFNAGSSKIAVIEQNNKVIREIELSKVKEPQRIELTGDYKAIILVEADRIRFEESNCPDQICVKTGWLSDKGDMAVCLPNKASIKIKGTNDSVDGVTF